MITKILRHIDKSLNRINFSHKSHNSSQVFFSELQELFSKEIFYKLLSEYIMEQIDH